MVDKKPPAYPGTRVDFDSGQETGKLAYHARDQEKPHTVKKVPNTVKNERVQTLVQ
jgi:hypothetical protein